MPEEESKTERIAALEKSVETSGVISLERNTVSLKNAIGLVAVCVVVAVTYVELRWTLHQVVTNQQRTDVKMSTLRSDPFTGTDFRHYMNHLRELNPEMRIPEWHH